MCSKRRPRSADCSPRRFRQRSGRASEQLDGNRVLRDGAPIAALLAEMRAAAARDFASGTVVALDGSRLARAEAAFALACYESLSAAGRGCG